MIDTATPTAVAPQESPLNTGARAHHSAAIAANIFVALGVAARLTQYLWRRSFWADESLLLLNIRDRSWPDLLGHLSYGQAAPPGFLLAQRCLLQIFGVNELSARLLPLLAGCAALLLFARLARRLLPSAIALVSIASFALSEDLIWYSATIKPYSIDVLIAVILLSIAAAQRSPNQRIAAALLTASIAAWFSYPATLVLAGVLTALAPAAWKQRPTRAQLLAALLCAASLLLLYLLVLRHQRDPYLQDYWAGGFADLHRPWTIPHWLIVESYNLSDLPFRSLGGLLMFLCAAGTLWLARSGRGQLAAICLLPVAWTVASGCLHLYPFHGSRVTLFLLPGLLLLGGFGLDLLARIPLAPRRRALLVAVAGAPFLLSGLITCSYHLFVPRSRSMIAPAVRYVRAHRRPGEALFLIGEGKDRNQPALNTGLCLDLLCYWPDAPPPLYTTMPPPRQIAEPRFWLVFAFLPGHRLTYMQPLLDRLAAVAEEEDRFIAPGGGAAILFHRRPASPPDSTDPAQTPSRSRGSPGG